MDKDGRNLALNIRWHLGIAILSTVFGLFVFGISLMVSHGMSEGKERFLAHALEAMELLNKFVFYTGWVITVISACSIGFSAYALGMCKRVSVKLEGLPQQPDPKNAN